MAEGRPNRYCGLIPILEIFIIGYRNDIFSKCGRVNIDLSGLHKKLLNVDVARKLIIIRFILL